MKLGEGKTTVSQCVKIGLAENDSWCCGKSELGGCRRGGGDDVTMRVRILVVRKGAIEASAAAPWSKTLFFSAKYPVPKPHDKICNHQK